MPTRQGKPLGTIVDPPRDLGSAPQVSRKIKQDLLVIHAELGRIDADLAALELVVAPELLAAERVMGSWVTIKAATVMSLSPAGDLTVTVSGWYVFEGATAVFILAGVPTPVPNNKDKVVTGPWP